MTSNHASTLTSRLAAMLRATNHAMFRAGSRYMAPEHLGRPASGLRPGYEDLRDSFDFLILHLA